MLTKQIAQKFILFFAVVCLLSTSCEEKSKKASPAPLPAASNWRPLYIDAKEFDNPNSAAHLSRALNSADLQSKEMIWALSFCDCAPRKAGEYLAKSAESVGILPQALVPSIKQEILSDSKLKFLMRLKGNFARIGGALERLFANDDKIADSIRDGVSTKIGDSLANGRTQIGARSQFRFDLFAPISNQSAQNRTMNVSDQAVVWAMPFARPEMWENSAPLAYGDHGMQLLHAAKALAAWQYAFGLAERDANPEIDPGGLAFNPNQIDRVNIGPFDPRENSGGQAHIISGTYHIDFPETGTIELATNVTPRWRRDQAPIMMEEQATLGLVAAHAFSRMRPDSATPMRSAFGGAGMFPANTHELPLIFLAGLGELLNGALINSDKQEIYHSISGVGQNTSGNLASLRGLTRLYAALTVWVQQTKNLSSARLSNSTQAQVEKSNKDLFRASQLVMQTILARFVRHGSFTTRTPSYSLIGDDGKSAPSFGESAELLATLTDSKSDIFVSPLLSHRINVLSNWFAATYLLNSNLSDSDPAAVLWTYKFLKNIKSQNSRLNSRQAETDWHDSAFNKVAAIISDWER